jgi:hypothetical protein
MTHDDFKIIAKGKELSFPVMRLAGIAIGFFILGLITYWSWFDHASTNWT